MEDQLQLQRNALQILAKSAEFYVNGLDDLAKNFVLPQIQAAIQILNSALEPVEVPAQAEKPAKK